VDALARTILRKAGALGLLEGARSADDRAMLVAAESSAYAPMHRRITNLSLSELGQARMVVAARAAAQGLDVRRCRVVLVFADGLSAHDRIQAAGRARHVSAGGAQVIFFEHPAGTLRALRALGKMLGETAAAPAELGRTRALLPAHDLAELEYTLLVQGGSCVQVATSATFGRVEDEPLVTDPMRCVRCVHRCAFSRGAVRGSLHGARGVARSHAAGRARC